MFTGIIESIGKVESVEVHENNKVFWVSSPISPELKVDQSVSHDGVCLTVEEIKNNQHRVTAIDETMKKTNLHTWHLGSVINLERSMQMNGRIDGHIVQGHVDATAECIERKNAGGSWEYKFRFPEGFAALVIEKGSISINGTSLTIFNITNDTFSVAIIPYTFEYTSINQVEKGSIVNIEFDMIGKYVNRIQSLSK
jgi:riboflavin synthase